MTSSRTSAPATASSASGTVRYNSDQPATLTETIANVNLRGLGASRTLVLINGRRQTYVPARLIGGRFVDVNAIPAIAIDRIEVLKEGASATYGSDAMAGVANFVTRKNFRGLEFNVTHDHFAGAGDSTVSGIWGGLLGSSHVVFAAERMHRRQLLQTERPDWGLVDYEGGRGEWSSVGNPGAFLIPTTTGMETPTSRKRRTLPRKERCGTACRATRQVSSTWSAPTWAGIWRRGPAGSAIPPMTP